nr:receptor-like protein EIX2 [Populus alba]
MLLINHDKSFHLLFVLIVLLLLMKLAPGFFSGVKGATFECIERERQALLKFKEDLIDDSGLLSTWGSEEEKRDCCKWRGVGCNNRTGHVTHLDLSGFNLTSSIFYWLANFGNSLVDLNLSNNHLQGSIPDAFTNMTSLRTLDLSNNQLQGDLSSFGRMCNLNVLNISENNLTGELPQLFQDWHGCVESSLQILQLNGNQLKGSLLDITRFTSMRELVISNNRLDGNVSESIGSLSQLEKLHVGGNSLQGVMSEAHFSNLSKLTFSSIFRPELK